MTSFDCLQALTYLLCDLFRVHLRVHNCYIEQNGRYHTRAEKCSSAVLSKFKKLGSPQAANMPAQVNTANYEAAMTRLKKLVYKNRIR
jgi:hypothetical protein